MRTSWGVRGGGRSSGRYSHIGAEVIYLTNSCVPPASRFGMPFDEWVSRFGCLSMNACPLRDAYCCLDRPLQTLDFQGCPLAYRIAGSGPPLVMIQGVGAYGTAPNPQVEILEPHYTCMTFDNRGIGA